MNPLAETPKKRIDSIDILRGIVMCIMAIDHTRDFFMAERFDPTDLTRAPTALFLTRFITHYCAATFVFLAGTGAFLYLNRGKTKAQASSFLLSRGLWLVILELTVVRAGWGWDGGIFLQVIWAIGVSMIILGLLVYLPLPVVGALGLLLIFGHDAFDSVSMASMPSSERTMWTFLHVQGMVHILGTGIFVMYPLIPWVGVMATGYAFGKLFTIDADNRKRILIILGTCSLLLFVLIRYFNIYGDKSIWTYQGNIHRTILSFIDVSKYPPSLDYLLITLGPGMLFLAFIEGKSNKLTDIFVVFGRVPLFYYILHLYLIHLSAIVLGQFISLPNPFAPGGGPDGLGLAGVYLVWLCIVTILYFPCRWFMQYKRTHRQWWLSYL